MPDSVNQETRAKIDELCKKIAIAHDLNPDIQSELSGHMEDKLLGYLSGQESLSEDDAFILVREHFGSPAKIKSLLQNVHYVAADLSLTRRLCAVSAVFLGFIAIHGFINTAAWGLAAWIRFTGLVTDSPTPLLPVGAFAGVITLVAGTYVCWRVLANWKRRLDAGEAPWFQRWSAFQITLVLGALAGLQLAIPGLSLKLEATDLVGFYPSMQRFSLLVNGLGLATLIICFVVQAGIWLWWSDSTPRRPRTLTITALAWLAFTGFPWSMVHLIRLKIYLYDPSTTTPDATNQLVLWHAHHGEYSGLWLLEANSIDQTFIYSLGMTFIPAIFAVALAKFIYLRIRREQTQFPKTTA
jgi:hypothetical protein